MDEKEHENDVNDIDIINPIDSSDAVIIYEEQTEGSYPEASVSNDQLKTGNILSQLFKLIANFREKEYWELNDKEVESLNNICPKLIPKFLSEHSGIIGCSLNLLGIIMKRIKLEQNEIIESETEIVEKTDNSKSLMGGRND